MNHGTVLRHSVDALLTKTGRSLVLRTVSEGAYDPITGTTAAPISTDRNVLVTFTSFGFMEIDGTKVVIGDRKALISGYTPEGTVLALEPQIDDKIIDDTLQMSIVEIMKKITVGGVNVAWIAQVRE